MYKLVIILRIVGVVTLLGFIISLFFTKENATTYFSLNYLQRNLIQLSLVAFAVTVILHFYQFLVKHYFKKNSVEEEA